MFFKNYLFSLDREAKGLRIPRAASGRTKISGMILNHIPKLNNFLLNMKSNFVIE